jgi:hypothetical protein
MNEYSSRRTWWQQNMKWFVPLAGVFILIIGFFTFTMFGDHFNNFAQAYAEDDLVENAVQIAGEDRRVQEVVGEIQPVDKMAVLNGEVRYSEDNNAVEMTIKIKGAKTSVMMDVAAERAAEGWDYHKIDVRIKNPPEKKQTINVLETTN